MPYKLSKDGKSVIKADTGEVVKKHKSGQEAMDHLVALKINVEDKENKKK